MSAVERDALVTLLNAVADDQLFGRFEGGYIPEAADRLLATGWTRPETGDDVIEQAAKEVAAAYRTARDAGAPVDSDTWLGERVALWLASRGLLATEVQS